MKILKNISDLKKAVSNITDLGFVPTMGGLHDGHISLINESKKKCNKTLVSIYVNPKQFNKSKDFVSYPRNNKKDIKLLKKLKVNFVFFPTTKELYRNKRIKKIILDKRDKILCAKYRKGHFEGVLDVMDRFINLLKPKYVFMGEKDFQQLYLLKKYIKNKYNTKIFPCKTIRDKQFVALSTRNLLLSKKNLLIASFIAKNLNNFKKKIVKNYKIKNFISKFKNNLQSSLNIKIDYLEIRNKKDLKVYKKKNRFKLFVAYHIDKVRLIDNF